MIPSSTLTTTQTGSIPGRTTPMTIDQVHMPHIMELLTRAYSDIIAAILREYSANAWDSHVAAGITRPIEVRTPNKYHPFLEVEDFGVGMSIDFVETEFSKYGASTKRTNNKEAGAFGIGGKSALAYTDQFTMVTVKDGVKGEFVIHRNAEGAAQITLVREETTTQGNGTLVSIPAKHNEDFDAKVDWFFKFWKPGTVLVDGEPPRQIKAEKVDEGVFYTPEGNNSYVVMGNIPYRVKNPSNYLPSYFSNFAFIIDVPMGSVSITPNREDLEYGDQGTIDTLKRVGKVFQEKMLEKIKKEILDEPDHYSAWERWNKWTQVIGNDYLKDLTYKGDKFVTYIEAAGYEWSTNSRYRGGRSIMRLGNRGKYIGNQYVYGPYVDIKELKHVIVHDKTTPTPWSEPSPYERQKTRWFFQEKGKNPSTVFFLDEVPVSPWVEGLKVYEWADVKKAKNPNYVPKSRQSTGGKVQVFGGTATYAYWTHTPVDELPDDETLVLITPYDADHYLDMKKLAAALTENSLSPTIIRLGENRWAKFKREHPNSVTLKEYLQDQVRIQRATIPKVSWLMKKLPYQQTRMLAGMDPNRIDDPDLAELAKQVNKHRHTYEQDFTRIRRLAISMHGLGADLDNSDDSEYDNPLDRYPLIAGLDYLPSGEGLDDAYYYINNKFKDKK